MDMDLPEETSSVPARSSLHMPRFELTNSVVTAIGRAPNAPSSSSVAAPPVAMTDQAGDSEDSEDDQENQCEYVMHVERNCDGTKLASALSSREIKLYSRDSMHFERDITGNRGHTGPITQLAFAPNDPFAMYSASADGTVKGWDIRTTDKSSISFGQSGEEIWSMALGYDGHLCAMGKGRTVEFYDVRQSGQALGTYSECHTDEVTQVAFHPHRHSFLATGSEDGLMCFFDTGVSSEEDALDSVMNAECAVRTLGFFGPEGEGLYCCTNTETLSLWHAHGAKRIAEFGDIRSLARGTEATTTNDRDLNIEDKSWEVSIDYIVGCRYEADADRLLLVAGEFEGSLCLASVAPDAITPEAVLEGGHREQVRAFDWSGSTIVTGGEDAKMCLWTAPGNGGGVVNTDNEAARSAGSGGAVAGGHGAASGNMVLQSNGAAARRGNNRAGRAFQPYDVEGRKR